ncbi:MAG: hypothetical protein Q9227_007346 [Pyrenula ochraceoflavens]
MLQSRLSDAAMALHRVLTTNGVRFGIFGGYAIGVLGGPRASKDVDCLASVNKGQIIGLLSEEEGFTAVPQSRTDYVAFLWSDQPDRRQAVLVEIFCEQFPGATLSMEHVEPRTLAVRGQFNDGGSCFFDPFYLFKGKLSAAATREKSHDSADLRWLESRYNSQIRARSGEISNVLVGLAIKRYEELEWLFSRIGVDVPAAKQAAAHLDPYHLPPPQPGFVQQGLLS